MASQTPSEQEPEPTKDFADETDTPEYPENVEGTGSERDDEPTLDEPIER